MVSYAFLKKIEVLPNPVELKGLKQATEWVVAALNVALVPLRQHAEISVGGSYAKGTLVASTLYDVDIFVRYPGELSELSQILLPALREICHQHRLPLEHVHGSRDYFRITYSPKIIFEIVPVRAIKKAHEAENVTDLSYAHVAYVRKELRKRKQLVREIGLAKLFCKAQRVYGAESYVQGFSGYAIECLIIAYGSFVSMLRALAPAREQIVLDPGKHYRQKREISLALNESKLKSPIVLVDPTWKERNVLAALNYETFARFQTAARNFLKKPSLTFFVQTPISTETLAERAQKQKVELVHIVLETLKQSGDIAGTKMKKFADTLSRYFSPHFTVVDREFVYSGAHQASAYFFIKPAKQGMRRGPPIKMKEHAQRFKREHPQAIVKRGILYAPLPRPVSGKALMKTILQKYDKMVREMDISMARVV